jgi:5-methyltetrahydrofolate--homocysteine methyltransferase
MTTRLLHALAQRVLVFDGAMGTATHKLTLDVERDYLGKENCTEVLNLTRPQDIQRIHESFLAVGCDAVETNTFGGMPHVLAEFALDGRCREINAAAVKVARAACAKYSTPDRPRYIAGSIGPGTKILTLGQISWERMLASYSEQVRALLDNEPTPAGARGVDLLLIETAQDLLQTKCAVTACVDVQRELGIWDTPARVPIFVQVTIETSGTMLLGTEISAAIVALAELPIDGLGMNCATGPKEMTEHVRTLSRLWPRYISVLPNAGLPCLVDGKTHFPLQPEPMADAIVQFVEELGVNVIGGCCGTTPEHLEAIIRRIGTRKPSPRTPALQPSCSSLYSAVELKQQTSILMVGERTNANGSKKFKEMLAAEDWDGLVSWARGEVKGGAHVLDVCVDYVGRDGVRDMHEVIRRYVQHVPVPLMLDSTEAAVLEAGLKLAGGKCIVNSINLEDGEKRFVEVCPLLKRYGAAVVALTIDEDRQAGMAKTAQRKLEIATRIHQLATQKYGIDEANILFDPLTFTIATGNDDDRKLGLETLEGIRLIAQALPRCGIILGLSNISFGLKPAARVVLNSVFLHEAVQRGMTAAILHPSKILPRHKIEPEQWDAAQWLIFDRRGDDRPAGMPPEFDPLLHFISLFPDGGEMRHHHLHQQDESLPIEQRLQNHIIDGEREKLEAHLDEALKKYDPLAIINEHLLAGMKVVGELFGSGQMQLPFVLQSAEVMKKAVAYLEPHMAKTDSQSKGRLVLATVKGDVHDIGKNLVDIILTNNGYQVFNLGIKQPLSAILEAYEKHQAHAIGMSGLLVKSVGVMQENLAEMKSRGLKVPTLLGGAALNRHYAETELRRTYSGPVYFGRDAFEALDLMEKIAAGKTGELEVAIEGRLSKRADVEAKVAASPRAASATAVADRARSDVRTDVAVPKAPFFGSRVVEHVPLEQIYPFVNRVALYRGQWGFKKGRMSDDDFAAQRHDEIDPIFKELADRCREEKILQPKVAYGYFPVNSNGDDLIVFDAVDQDREALRFTFPRQSDKRRLCISDFFKSVDSGQKDVLGLSCVTMGPEASRRAKELFAANEYKQYLYLHGMGVECAEALAELWHKRMRQELGIDGDDSPQIRELFIQKYRGSRYSFGYPACPDMSDQDKLFALIDPTRIGCVLTENWQIDPEQSTSAIIVHHPEAKYFNV